MSSRSRRASGRQASRRSLADPSRRRDRIPAPNAILAPACHESCLKPAFAPVLRNKESASECLPNAGEPRQFPKPRSEAGQRESPRIAGSHSRVRHKDLGGARRLTPPRSLRRPRLTTGPSRQPAQGLVPTAGHHRGGKEGAPARPTAWPSKRRAGTAGLPPDNRTAAPPVSQGGERGTTTRQPNRGTPVSQG